MKQALLFVGADDVEACGVDAGAVVDVGAVGAGTVFPTLLISAPCWGGSSACPCSWLGCRDVLASFVEACALLCCPVGQLVQSDAIARSSLTLWKAQMAARKLH